jgi:hypothetical protein
LATPAPEQVGDLDQLGRRVHRPLAGKDRHALAGVEDLRGAAQLVVGWDDPGR